MALCRVQEDSVVHVFCANGCQSVVLCVILTNRCQSWLGSGVSQLKYGAHSTSSLDHLWLQHSPCGSSWVLREPPLWRDAHWHNTSNVHTIPHSNIQHAIHSLLLIIYVVLKVDLYFVQIHSYTYVGEPEGNVGIKNRQAWSHIVYIGHIPHVPPL